MLTPLIADLMEQCMRDTHAVTNALIDSLEHRALRAEVTVQIIRERIYDLFDGPYTPQPSWVIHALYPSEEEVKERMELEREDAG